MNKYSICLLILLVAIFAVPSKAQNIVFTEASDLTLTGKLMDTPNPYHRVDTVQFKGFNKGENKQVRNSAGIAVAFRTNTKSISVLTEYGDLDYPNNTGGFSARGYDRKGNGSGPEPGSPETSQCLSR